MIQFKSTVAAPKETTLNDIPVGATFRGEVQTASGEWHKGLFLKAYNTTTITGSSAVSMRIEVLVVCLEPASDGRHYTWHRCMPVRNYVPVDLTIEVKEIK